MIPKGRSLGVALSVIAFALIISAPAGAQLSQIHYFPIGGTNYYPAAITAGPDGALWFAEAAGHIGRITMTGQVTPPYLIPYQGSSLDSITPGPDGALWFTDQGPNSVGRIDTEGHVIEYVVPTPNCLPFQITAGPDGNLWFVETLGNKIGSITPQGSFTEYPAPSPNGNLYGITAGPDGALWFTEGTGKIGRIVPGSKPVDYPLPTGYIPYGITTGSDGAIWFAVEGNPHIGRSTTGSNPQITFPFTTVGEAVSICPGPDGGLWFIGSYSNGSNYVGVITKSGVISYNPVDTPSYGIASGPDGAVWFVSSSANSIAQAVPSLRRNGIDLSASGRTPTGAVLTQLAQAGVQFAVVKAPQSGQNDIATARSQLNAFLGAGFKTAAYCYLHFTQNAQSGTTQAQNCLCTIDGYLSSLSFVAVDVEDEQTPVAPLATRLQIISDALQTISGAGAPTAIYTAAGYWSQITNNSIQFSNQPLWAAATFSFEGYTDTAANLSCGFGAISLTPLPHGGSGVPNLKPVSFGGWTVESGHQYDIGNTASTCLFGTKVDFDVFGAPLFDTE